MSRFTLFAKTLVSDFERCACCKHGVGQDQSLSCKVRSAGIFDVDVKILTLVIFPVCCHECVLCVVEVVEDTLMKRKSGTKDGCYNYAAVISRDLRYSKRCHILFAGIVKVLAYLIGENLAESFEISAETHAVLLDSLVTHLRNEFVENGIFLSKVDDFHFLCGFVF